MTVLSASDVRVETTRGTRRADAGPKWRDARSERGAEAAAGGAAAHPRHDVTSRIIGGVNAPRNAYPWMTWYRGQGNCGGALIDKDWVVTAAHCGSPNWVLIGARDLAATNYGQSAFAPVVRNVAETIVHPNYGQFNDIALLRLATSAPAELTPVRIAAAPPAVGDVTTTIGWGNMEPFQGFAAFPNILQTVDITVNPNRECLASMRRNYEICAGDVDEGEEGQDSCQGDSGGPLFVTNEDCEPLHVGIVSRGVPRSTPEGIKMCAGNPGIYTDSTAYRNWIYTHVPEPPAPPPPPPSRACSQSAEACTSVLRLKLTTDKWGRETHWTFGHAEGEDATDCPDVGEDACRFTYADETFYSVVVARDLCPGETYRFEMKDSWGDGICCSEGLGSYTLNLDGKVIFRSDGDFGDREVVTIALPASTDPPTDKPTAKPSRSPTELPTADPTADPMPKPTAGPTAEPPSPTAGPTADPTAGPTADPTAGPTADPTAGPTTTCDAPLQTQWRQNSNRGGLKKNCAWAENNRCGRSGYRTLAAREACTECGAAASLEWRRNKRNTKKNCAWAGKNTNARCGILGVVLPAIPARDACCKC